MKDKHLKAFVTVIFAAVTVIIGYGMVTAPMVTPSRKRPEPETLAFATAKDVATISVDGRYCDGTTAEVIGDCWTPGTIVAKGADGRFELKVPATTAECHFNLRCGH